MSENGEEQAKFFVENLEELDGFITKLENLEDNDEDFLDEHPVNVIDEIMNEQREVFDPDTESHYSLTQPLSVDEVKEIRICICTGGPAVQVVAKYWPNDNEPFYVALQHQSWFKPWTDYDLTSKQKELMEDYVRHFVYIE